MKKLFLGCAGPVLVLVEQCDLTAEGDAQIVCPCVETEPLRKLLFVISKFMGCFVGRDFGVAIFSLVCDN